MQKKTLADTTLTEGYYDILRDDELIGHEWFHVHPLLSGFLLKGEIEYTWPREHSVTYEYQVTREWDPVALRTSLQAGDIARRGSLRRDPSQWAAAVRDTDGSTTRETFRLPDAEVDFASPLFNMATLLRHRIPPGGERQLDVVFVEVASLSPAPNKLSYRATPEEALGGESLQWKGRKYFITDLGGSAPTDLVVHRSGLVLEHRTRMAGGLHRTTLTEWDQEFDWPVLW